MKKLSIFLFAIFICISFVSAQGEHTGGTYSKQGAEYMDTGLIVNTLMYDVVALGKNITVYMTPYEISGKTIDNNTATCRLGMVNPDGSRLLLLLQENFTVIGEDDIWTAVIPGTFLNETGEYLLNWDCQTGIRGGYFNSILTVTQNGRHHDIPLILTHIGLVILFMLLFVGFYYIRKTINFEKWYSGILKRYENKNYVKMILSTIGYYVMKQPIVIYYLIGFPIILLLTSMVNVYEIFELAEFMGVILYVYSWGAIIVALVFLSYVQEFSAILLEKMRDLDWGFENGK